MLVITMLVPLTLALFSDFDWHPVLTGYLGLTLMGGLFLAVGLFASSITENQIVAAFTSLGMLLMCWLLAALGKYLGDTPTGNIVSYPSFTDHFDRLIRGSSTPKT